MNERFLELIREIETALRTRLGNRRSQRVGFSDMIEDYRQRNPYWHREAEDLDILREIRNYLTHDRSHHLGDPVVVTQDSIDRLGQIRDGLIAPRPIAEQFGREVVTVRPGDTLATVLALAFQHAFSQFPVVESNKFRGVITENEIIRWLGQQVSRGESVIDTTAVVVDTVLEQAEPERPDIFRFMRLDAPEQEVMGLFQRQPALEVVILTESGNGNTPLAGILTQWDAARYPGGGADRVE